jgi:hypothetical protein
MLFLAVSRALPPALIQTGGFRVQPVKPRPRPEKWWSRRNLYAGATGGEKADSEGMRGRRGLLYCPPGLGKIRRQWHKVKLCTDLSTIGPLSPFSVQHILGQGKTPKSQLPSYRTAIEFGRKRILHAIVLAALEENSNRKRDNSMEPIDRNELAGRLRREFARYQFHVNAEITWRSKVWGRVTDISRGGMFIEVADPPGLGASLTVRLALNVPLRLECVVRRIVPDQGVGVTISVGKRAQKRFDALLLALSTGADPAEAGANITQPQRPRTKAVAAGR